MSESGKDTGALGLAKWYELFSRGARDWLRHDEKVRESVREHLPQIIAGGEVINDSTRTVRVASSITATLFIGSELSLRSNASIRPSGERVGETAESVKLVSCV